MKRAILLFLTLGITVKAQTTTTLVPLQSVWKYLDNGTNQGTAWRAPGFDDSTWAQGAAELGYGDGDETTVVGYGGNPSARYITTYFRKTFTVTGAAAYTSANLRVRRDDGVVIYLNGTEVYRNTMPAGTITYTTLSSAVAADEVSLFPGTVSPALLQEGTNVLAVEIHQSNATSSDISFDMDFTATIVGTVPTAGGQSVAVTEDTPKAITLTGSDPNGDPLTYSIVTNPAQGTLSGTPPAVTYTPNLNYTGSDSFTFTVSDGSNTSAAATVNIAVSPVNDTPVAYGQSVNVAEDGQVEVILNGTDVESRYGTLADYTQQLYNASLTGVIDGLSGATYNEITGTLFLIRNVSGGGGHSYEYSADGNLIRTITQTGFQDTEAIAWMYGNTYAIAEENDFQRITICTISPGATTLNRTDSGNVTWTTPVGSLLNLGIESLCYDAGRNRLYYLIEKPSSGTWNIWSMNPETGVSTVLCDLNASIFSAGLATDLTDMVHDRATDTLLLLSHESSKIIRIDRSGNVLEQRGFTTAITQAEALTLTADRRRMFVGGEPKQFARYELPANTLTYELVTPPAHGSLTGIPPRVTYVPQPDYFGTDSFQFRVSDGTAYSLPSAVDVTVTPENDPPVGSGVSATAEASEATIIVLPVTDTDGDQLAIQTSAPAHGTVTVDGTSVIYTAEAAYSGTDSFTYTVSDGAATSQPYTVNITVIPFNFAPVASDASPVLVEDTPGPVVLEASDQESDPLSWSIVAPPLYGSLSGSAPNLTYSPDTNFHGSDSFTFRVNDGKEYSNTAAVSITVSPVNDVPVASGSSAGIEAGAPLPLVLEASDVDGDSLTFAITSPPQHGVLTGMPPSLTYTADIGYAGTDSLSFTASDSGSTSMPAEVTINVAAFNAPPTAQSDTVVTSEDTSVGVVLVANDPESQPLVYTITVPAQHGSLSGTPPSLIYTPAPDYHGADSFAWTVGDGQKISAAAVCSLTISPVNDAPVVQSFTIPTETTTPAAISLAGSDVEGAALTYSIVTHPSHGVLSGTPPTLLYTPDAGFTGTDSITYKANDGELDSGEGTISLPVSAPALDVIVPAGSVWKYLDNGSDQGTSWRAAAYNDSAWLQGPAQLGYGDGDEATTVGYGPNAASRYVTTYFRREFNVPNVNVLTGALNLEVLRDDGAVVYLNGVEVFRSNMPAGTVTYGTFASSELNPPAESSFSVTLLNKSLILPGRNVLAVEIHQASVSSADLSFDLRLAESLPAVNRGPYVQMTGPDRATIRWRTNVAISTVLNYGLSLPDQSQEVVSPALKTEHEVTLTGLLPDSQYFYSLRNPLGTIATGASYYFHTHPPVGTQRPYRFWIIGDMGTGDSNQTTVRDAFYTWNGAQKIDGVLMLGDNAYETGTDSEYQTKFFDMYPTRLRNTTFWPSFGNHDAGSASSATQSGPYYNNFTMPKFAEVGGVASGTEAYYSFDYGNIHFVCLDSEGTSRLTTGAMASWLEQDLSANLQEWTIAFWHHPPYSKGSHDSDVPTADGGRMKDMREVFVPILENHGVDLLLFGHEHTYQRSKFIDGHYGVSSTFNPLTMLKQAGMGNPSVDGPYMKSDGPHNGAVFTVAGSSGKLTPGSPNHAVMAANFAELGSVALDVNGRELTARFLNNTGVVRDTFSIVHNTAPVAQAVNITGPEDSTVSVLLSGSDPENDVLSYEIVSGPGVGELNGAAPNLLYTPPADFNGVITFSYRVRDGRVNSPVTTVSLTITPVNDIPVPAPTNVSIAEDTSAAIVLSASDTDGDQLTYSVTETPMHGVLSGDAPNLLYLPAQDWYGEDSFKFTVTDASGSAAEAVVTIFVAPANDLPVSAAQSISTNEDSAQSLELLAFDVDGDALTFDVTGLPEHGTLAGVPPNLVYTPDPNYYGADRIVYIAGDGSGISTPGIVDVTVTPVNDPPVSYGSTWTAIEDLTTEVVLQAYDVDGDPLTYTITAPPLHGTLTGVAPHLNYIPASDYHGSDQWSYLVSDGSAASAESIIHVEVSPVNDAPVAESLTVETAEDTPVGISLVGSDPDGDVLTAQVMVPPAHGSLSGSLPDLIYVPEPDWSGEDSFSYLVTDGVAASSVVNVSVVVSPVNDAPVAENQSFVIQEDNQVEIILAATDVDGDEVEFTISASPEHGTLSGIAPNLTYTPDPDWNGTDVVVFAVSDGLLSSPSGVITIEVSPVNDVPVAASAAFSGLEDVPQAISLQASDSDGDPVSFALTALPEHGVISGTAPHLIYTPDANWHGNDQFSFSVSDAIGVSIPAVVTIQVEAVNDLPAGAPIGIILLEDSAVVLNLTAVDEEGDEVEFTITQPPAHGTLSGTAPELTYTPAPDFHGTDTFKFSAADSHGAGPSVPVTLTVTQVNDAPSASAMSRSGTEDSPMMVPLEGNDVDGDLLSFSITVPPVHGILTGEAPNLHYTPFPDYHGPDAFAYIVNDGVLNSSPALVSLSLSSINDRPVAQSQFLNAIEDTAIAIALNGSDVDGDTLSYAVLFPPSHGTLTGVAPFLNYTPAANWSGNDIILFVAIDGAEVSPIGIVSISVAPVNDAPAALAFTAATSEDTTIPLLLSGEDIEGSELTFSIVTPPGHGTLSGVPPAVTYIPNPDFYGIDTFYFKVSDGSSESPPAQVTIVVEAVNDPPVALSQAISCNEDTQVAFLLGAIEPEGGLMTFRVTQAPIHGSLSGDAPNLIYTPNVDYSGTDTLTFVVNDGQSDSAPSSIAITVVQVNDAPAGVPQAVVLEEDGLLPLLLEGDDPDGDELNFIITEPPLHGSVTGNGSGVIYVPSPDYHGADNFSFVVSDGVLLSSPAVVQLEVLPINDAPETTPLTVLLDEDSEAPMGITASDVDGDLIEFTITVSPSHGTLSGVPPNLSYTPHANYHGADSFSFVADDGLLTSATEVVGLIVRPVNDAPVVQAQEVEGLEDGFIPVVLSGTDADGDPIGFEITRQPIHGSLTGTIPYLTYVPSENYHGNDGFEFRALDTEMASAVETVSISVLPMNDEPYANDLTLFTDEDAGMAFLLGGGDIDGDALTFHVLAFPEHGSLSGTAPNLVYTPDADWSGADSFAFRVFDGSAYSTIATGVINVLPVNDRPTSFAQVFQTVEDVAVSVLLSGSDPEGDVLSYEMATFPEHGTLTGTPPLLVYTPDPDFHGQDGFTYAVSDELGAGPVALISILVGAENDRPVASGQELTGVEDSLIPVLLTGSDSDGDGLLYSITIPPAHGTLSGSPPNVSYIPNPDYHGGDSFVFTVSDGVTASEPASVHLTVLPLNDAPVVENLEASVDEDGLKLLTLSGTDADGDNLTFTVTMVPLHGVLTGEGHELTYVPDPNYHGIDSFSFTGNDGTVSSAPATVQVVVVAVNDTPVASSLSVSMNEDETGPFTLPAFDVDGDPLSFSIVEEPSHGVLTGTAPNLVYIPSPDFHGEDTIQFVVTDGSAISSPGVIEVSILPVNDAPLGVAQNLILEEDSSLPVALSGSDVDGDPISFSIAAVPAHGTLSGSAPNLVYTPNNDFHGRDEFSFTVSDGLAESVPTVVSIEITAVNDLPVSFEQSLNTDEDTALSVTLSGFDFEGALLSFEVIAPPLHGSLSGIAPNLTYVPDLNWSGVDILTFVVSDGMASSLPATVTIQVSPVNDAPVIMSVPYVTDEEDAVMIALSGMDADEDTLAFFVGSGPQHGTLSGVPPLLVYTPDPDFNGTDWFSYIASDGISDSFPAQVMISVLPVNDAPQAVAQSLSTSEDTSMAFSLSGTDVDEDELVFTITQPPLHGSLSGFPPDLTYTPHENYHGPDEFSFSVSDGIVSSAVSPIAISVEGLNDLPLGLAQTIGLAEDTQVSLTLLGLDADGDSLSYTVTSLPAHGTLTGTAPWLTYTPTPNYEGTDSFSFVVSDGIAQSAATIISLVISAENDRPTVQGLSLTVAEDGILPFTLEGADDDEDSLTFIVITPPSHGTIEGTAPNLIYTPVPDFYGTDQFEYIAIDAQLSSIPAVIAITVVPVNDPPVAVSMFVGTNEDTPVAVLLEGHDVELDALTFTVTNPPLHGHLIGSNEALIYVPDADWSGTDTFAFNASDGNLSSEAQLVTVNVAPVNDLPVAVPQLVSGSEDVPIPLQLTGTDVDGDDLIFEVTFPPIHGVLSGSGAHLVYTPTADFHGTDTFAFKMSDGQGDSAAVEVGLQIAAVNDVPVANGAFFFATEDQSAPVVLSGTDQDGDVLSYTISSGPLHGVLTGMAPDWVYVPDANYFGEDVFHFVAHDGVSSSMPAAVVVSVMPENDLPVVENLSFTGHEDDTIWISLAAKDPDGDLVEFQISHPPLHGEISGTGPDFVYHPDPNWSGVDSFQFFARDAQGDSAPATAQITVAPVNDLPVGAGQLLEVIEDETQVVILSAADVEGEELQFVITASPVHGVLTGVAPNFNYTPNPDYHGPDSFSFVPVDAEGPGTAAVVNVVVNAVNDVPIAVSQNLTGFEDSPVSFSLGGSDIDGDLLSFIIVSPPEHGTISGDMPQLVYTPDANWSGADSLGFLVVDTNGGTAPGVVVITVNSVNDSPSASSQTVFVDEDGSLPVILSGSDIEGSALLFRIVEFPFHGVLSGTAPDLIYTPDENYNGPDFFVYAVSDGELESVTAQVGITVSSVNDAPVSSFDVYSTTEDTLLMVTAARRLLRNDSDFHDGAPGESNQPLTARLVTPPPHAETFALNSNGTFSYQPKLNYHGIDAFTYRAVDALGGESLEETVLIAVLAENDAPVALPLSVKTLEDVPVLIRLRSSDVDLLTASGTGDMPGVPPGNSGPAPHDADPAYVIVSPPLHGSLSGAMPNWVYTPNPDFHGNDSFSFTVDDGLAVSEPAVVSIEVRPDSDADALPDAWELASFGSLAFDGGSDPDGDGEDNAFELISGHEPNDAADFLTLEPAGQTGEGDAFRLNRVRPGVTYCLECSVDLEEWITVSEVQYFIDGPGAIYDPRPPDDRRRFYKVTVTADSP